MVSGDSKGTIIIWEVETRKKIHKFRHNQETEVRSIAFSPNTKQLATLNKDTAVWLWNLEAHQRWGYPLRHGYPAWIIGAPMFNGLAFSPDGMQLASLGINRDILLWDVNLASWQARACLRANRNLTQGEWTRFIGPDMTYHATCPDLPPSKEMLLVEGLD